MVHDKLCDKRTTTRVSLSLLQIQATNVNFCVEVHSRPRQRIEFAQLPSQELSMKLWSGDNRWLYKGEDGKSSFYMEMVLNVIRECLTLGP